MCEAEDQEDGDILMRRSWRIQNRDRPLEAALGPRQAA